VFPQSRDRVTLPGWVGVVFPAGMTGTLFHGGGFLAASVLFYEFDIFFSSSPPHERSGFRAQDTGPLCGTGLVSQTGPSPPGKKQQLSGVVLFGGPPSWN